MTEQVQWDTWPRQCPAYGEKSGKCGKYNHFAQSCGASVTTVKINNRSQAGGGSNFTISNLNINNIR